jgi:FSR family fosmidomycin resistance protein-like MFS transporter
MALVWIARWFTHHQRMMQGSGARQPVGPSLSRRRLVVSFAVLGALLLSKFVYIETFKSYYAFFLIEKYGLGVAQAQAILFVFLAAVAFGTFFGGPVGDHIGRKKVIWVSIVGALPFAMVLPHVPLWGAVGLSIVVGLVLSSAFSAIVVFAQELLPQKVGMVAGFVFGFAFGVGALGAAGLGALADRIGMEQVFGYLPLLLCLGFLTALLPEVE